jgi:hypothetical protein
VAFAWLTLCCAAHKDVVDMSTSQPLFFPPLPLLHPQQLQLVDDVFAAKALLGESALEQVGKSPDWGLFARRFATQLKPTVSTTLSALLAVAFSLLTIPST